MGLAELPQQKCTQKNSSPKYESPKCPECGSQQIWKDGIRYNSGGKIQRYLCRECGYRFSEPNVKINVAAQPGELLHSGANLTEQVVSGGKTTIKEGLDSSFLFRSENVRPQGSEPQCITTAGKDLNAFLHYNSDCQVCVDEKKMKNLVKVETRQKQATGATENKLAKSVFGKFEYFLMKEGLATGTIQQRTTLLKKLATHCNLYDAESVKLTIARIDTWSKGTKRLAVIAYENFAEMEGFKFKPPTYRPDGTHPFVPTEQEVDVLIAGCGPKMAAFMQLIKETGVRTGEAWRLKWVDINPENRTVRITAEKGSKPRTLKISRKCYAMIDSMPRESEKIWPAQLHSIRVNYHRQRMRLARKLKNPRLEKITFCTLRHWYATNLYHQTKDILYVKNALGHRFVGNTMIYIDLEQAIYANTQDDQFTAKVATNLSEACQLLESGFDYIGNMHGHELFRKRK
jgi:integrase/predicted RNA-binding Zn-ribbon protein involved in translation (DUF1610 family)